MQRRSFLQLLGLTGLSAATPLIVTESLAPTLPDPMPSVLIEKHWVISRGNYTGRALLLGQDLWDVWNEEPWSIDRDHPDAKKFPMGKGAIKKNPNAKRVRRGGLWTRGKNAGLPIMRYHQAEPKGVVEGDFGSTVLGVTTHTEGDSYRDLLEERDRFHAEVQKLLETVQHGSYQLVTILPHPLKAWSARPYRDVGWVQGQRSHYLVQGIVQPKGVVWSEDGRVPLEDEVDADALLYEHHREGAKRRIVTLPDEEAYQRELEGKPSLGHLEPEKADPSTLVRPHQQMEQIAAGIIQPRKYTKFI